MAAQAAKTTAPVTDAVPILDVPSPSPPQAQLPIPDQPVQIKSRRYRAREDLFTRDHAGRNSQVFRLSVPDDTPYEEIIKEEFWANVARIGINIFDEIYVCPANCSYYARLLVRDVGPVWLKVVELQKWDFAPVLKVGDRPATGLAIKWNTIDKHHVVRTADNSVISRGYATEDGAIAAMHEYARARAR